jgi:hypothetical protein
MVGAAGYFAALQGQLESTLQLTTAWATAMSAFSSTILSPTGDRASGGTPVTGFQRLYAVRTVDATGTPTVDHVWPQQSWARQRFEPRAGAGMLRWLTEPPTLQADLFDEAVELLVDEDIKTAS